MRWTFRELLFYIVYSTDKKTFLICYEIGKCVNIVRVAGRLCVRVCVSECLSKLHTKRICRARRPAGTEWGLFLQELMRK